MSIEYPDFFSAELPDAYKKYLKYANFPRQALEKRLKTDDYEDVIHEFYQWTKRDFNATYLPTEETLRKELYLIKAEHFEDESEDVALFGDIAVTQNRKAKVRITQTGGVGSRIFFFVNYAAIKGRMSAKKAEETILEAIYTVLNNPERIGNLIAGISQKGELFEIRKKPVSSWKYHLQTFQGFIFGHTACLAFKKDTFSEDDWEVPAREPMPNEWFEFHKRA